MSSLGFVVVGMARRVLLLAVCVVGISGNSALLELMPGQSDVLLGEQIAVDVVLSDLGGDVVSAYDLDVLFDPGVVTVTDVVFGLELGEPAFFEVLNDFDLSQPGVVDFAQISLLSDSALQTIQPFEEVVLATLIFDAIGVGLSPLTFLLNSTNDIKGANAAVLPVVATGGEIRVTGSVSVPEPGALFLIGAGLLALRYSRTGKATARS